MTPLGAADFAEFFGALHGQDPFPWQARLARQVVETGRWPPLLDLPTAAGKTATVDVALFHLACEANKGAERAAPLRILFVVDRRIVVDEAFRRARRIADRLRSATDGVLRAVADRLSLLSGDPSHPLDVVRLRGGVPQERDWARSPAQPLVAVSTVDQVGSRLLFRGYGVSSRMSPVHAGLVGADALWLLDEVHLSQPLAETLAAIAVGHQPDEGGFLADSPRLAPFAIVPLSATPGDTPQDAFGLRDEDRCHPILSRRLSARKLARLAPVGDNGDLGDAFVEQALYLAGFAPEPPAAGRPRKRVRKAEAAQASASCPAVCRLAVVVNRVDLARQVFERLRGRIGEDRAEVVLLTGRVRPLDRERLLDRIRPLFASPDRETPERPIIIVATQTIEAGADLDVDALVTEIAPVDSLRQRFGRLDRLGLRGESRAAILMPKKAGQWGDPDWQTVEKIYGDRARATAEKLTELGDEVDFGIEAFSAHQGLLSADLITRKEHAPVLLPPYADLWATSHPEPPATPEPALFLHGPEVSADVQLVWRADVSPEDSVAAARWLELCPPSSLEAMSVPIWAVRRWLRDEGIAFSDVPEQAPEERGEPGGRACLRRAGDGWERAGAADLRPGDTIVVPSSYGGCDEYGWNPQSREPVRDLGVEAHYRQRLRSALRLTEPMLANACLGIEEPPSSEVWSAVRRLIPDEESADAAEALRAGLLEIEGLPPGWRRLLEGMQGPRLRCELLDANDPTAGALIWSDRRLPEGLLGPTREDEEAPGSEAVTDYEESSATGVEVDLTSHLGSVGARAREFAERAGLPPDLVRILSLAGRLHDLGKADPRFQADLRGESALARRHPELAALLAEAEGRLLAKSGQRRPARVPGAAPPGFRHEALSVALAQKHPEVRGLDPDARDLLLWLIGTHHGFGRPFYPPPQDDAPETAAAVAVDGEKLTARAAEAPLRLDQGWFELADRVRRRFGPWELARLEAVLRLADHAVSAQERAEAG